MYNIDEIMDMLDWNNPISVQAKGCELAGSIKCINVFLQPGHPGHGKNVWENCAKILSKKSDAELSPYLMELFDWVKDLNWPGAVRIFERLLKYEPNSSFVLTLDDSINIAKATNENIWLNNLTEIKDNIIENNTTEN